MSVTPQSAMQNSFAGGELSPSLFGRVDLAKYHTGLSLCRNAIVDYRGGVTNRPGTRYVGLVLDSSKKQRLIPFTYSNVQTYILVFSDFNMRVIRNGGYVTEPAFAISRSGSTYTAIAHGLLVGQWVSLTDQVHPALVNAVSTNTFTLINLFTGTPVLSNSTTAARVYTLPTPWAQADLALLKFSQSFDTMTLTHPNYIPYNLTRSQHWVWTLSAITFASTAASPTITSINVTVTGTLPTNHDTGYGYVVTAVLANGDESNPSAMVSFQSFDMAITPATYKVTWSAVAGATQYNIYRTTAAYNSAVDAGAPTGYIGYATDTTFSDSNIVPDYTKTPPTHQNPFAGGNNPATSTYFDQRKAYGGSNTYQQTLWLSRPGQYNNMDTSVPANDGDALTLPLSTTQAAVIKALVPMPGGLVVFTSSGVFQASGGSQFEGIKVSTATARQQAYGGANDVPPIPLNYEILYVQSKGSIVRSLTYNLYTSTYQSEDLTLFANHLFKGFMVSEWTYAEDPYKLIMAVRSDGTLLTLTYVKDEKILGWAHSDTVGTFESIASVQEGNTDAVYVVVNRAGIRFIERFVDKDISHGIQDAWYVDNGLDYANESAPVTTISGLDHLIGKTVAILASGIVKPQQVVSNTGTITLASPSTRVIVGLPFQTQCATLNLEPGGGSVQGKRKRIVANVAKVVDTGPLKYGPNFNELVLWTDTREQLVNGIMTGDQPLTLNQFYDYGGQVCWQQDDPLPMTVVSLVPELSVGD